MTRAPQQRMKHGTSGKRDDKIKEPVKVEKGLVLTKSVLINRVKVTNCEVVAMESTGVYWKPVYNLPEEAGIKTIAVNARHIKGVPGRKTDAKDSEWIADLVRHGLVKESCIPNREQREQREHKI